MVRPLGTTIPLAMHENAALSACLPLRSSLEYLKSYMMDYYEDL